MFKKISIIFPVLCIVHVSLFAMQEQSTKTSELLADQTKNILTQLQLHNASLLHNRNLTTETQEETVKSLMAITQIMGIIGSLSNNTNDVLNCIKQSELSSHTLLIPSIKPEDNISDEFLEKQAAIYNQLFESLK